MNRSWRRRFGASVAVALTTVGLSVLAGTAAADTYPVYTCPSVNVLDMRGQLLGPYWVMGGEGCAGPVGPGGPGAIIDTGTGRIYNCGSVSGTIIPDYGLYVSGLSCQ